MPGQSPESVQNPSGARCQSSFSVNRKFIFAMASVFGSSIAGEKHYCGLTRNGLGRTAA